MLACYEPAHRGASFRPRPGPRRLPRREIGTTLGFHEDQVPYPARYAAEVAHFLAFVKKPLSWVTLTDLQAPGAGKPLRSVTPRR
jgi:hypothetical protein